MKGGKRNSVLSIDSVQARHAGKYSCRAKNHAAAVNYTTSLIVNGITLLGISINLKCFLSFIYFLFDFIPKFPRRSHLLTLEMNLPMSRTLCQSHV